MNAIRRTAVLLGLTATVIVGSSIPAAATFSASTTAQRATVGTVTVTAPTSVEVEATCSGGRMTADVTWPKSTSPGVTGYTLVATVPSQPTITAQAGTNATFSYSTGQIYSAQKLPVTVTITTKTSYGWTKASAPLNATVTTC